MTITPDTTRIGWIGTGVMGASMAGHLLDGGYRLTLFNRTKTKAEPLINRGATWADSPGDVAAASDVVFTIVGMPRDVRSVSLGDNGVVGMAILQYEGTTANIHVMLMSCRVLGRTVEQTFLKWLARRAMSRGCDTLTAEYAETPKNRPFGRFYADAGLSASTTSPENATIRWSCVLKDFDMTVPQYMTIAEPAGRNGNHDER